MNPDILLDPTPASGPVHLFPGTEAAMRIETAGLALISPQFSWEDGISDDLARVADFVAANGVGAVGGVMMPFGYVATTIGAAIAIAWVGGQLLEAVGLKGPVALAAAGVLAPMALEVVQKRTEARK